MNPTIKKALALMVIIAAIAGMGYQYFLAANIKTELYPNGNVKSVTNMIGQTAHGLSTIYHKVGLSKRGERSAVYNYVDGVKQGLATTYYSTGRKKTEVKYVDGKKSGVESLFSTSGRKIAETNYTSDVEGKTTKWSYHNGATKSSEREFLNGIQINDEKTWHPNGKDKSLVSYVDGKMQGVETSWHDNMQKASEITYNSGVKHGSIIAWDASGNKISEGDYVNGQINKNTIWTFHPNNIIASKTLMVKGNKQGEYQAWHDNGKQADLVSYENNRRSGERTQWHDNAVKSAQTKYISGNPDGAASKWDEQSRLIEIIEYDAGKKGTSVTNTYNSKGDLIEKQRFNNDVLNGISTIWFANGVKANEANYSNGKLSGLLKTWNEAKDLREQSTYANGVRGNATEWTYFADSKMRSETHFINQSKEGVKTTWFSSGQMNSKVNYENNIRHGVETRWHENAQMSSKTTYVVGKVDGASTNWHPNGTISSENVYTNGRHSGLSTSYTDAGVIKQQSDYDSQTFRQVKYVSYKDGKKHGLIWEKYPNGKPKSNEEYVNGDNINTAIWYQRDGETIRKIVQYQHEKKQFEKTVSTTAEGSELVEISAYIDNNTKSFSMKMVDGALDGEKIDYFADGTLMSVLNFKDGELSGDFLSYHANGNLQIKGQYVAGVKVGLFQEYYSANQKLSEITYNESGELHGTIKYWRKDGSLTQTLLFEDGYLNKEKSESKIYLSAPSDSTKEMVMGDNGVLTQIYHHRNKKKVGSDIYIGEFGLKTAERNFSDKFATNRSGLNYSLEGTTTLWYENGMKQYEGSFRAIKAGKNPNDLPSYYSYPRAHVTRHSNPIGEHTWYRKDGSIEKIINYKGKNLHGLKTIFNESGLRRAMLNYKPRSASDPSGTNYSLDGIATLWYKNGMREYEGSFKSIKYPNQRNMAYHYTYPTSTVTRHSNRSGRARWFNKEGTVSKVENYKKNQSNGLRTDFFDNGRKSAELNYKPRSASDPSGTNYSLDGIATLWYKNGMREYEGSFKSIKYPNQRNMAYHYTYPTSTVTRHSNPVGEHTWWQKNGSLKDKKDYKKGK